MIAKLAQIKGRFVKTSDAIFLRTEDQAKFSGLHLEMRAILEDALGPGNIFLRSIISAVNNGHIGLHGGPSYKCVLAVEEQLQSSVRAMERKQRNTPAVAPEDPRYALGKIAYVASMRIEGLQSLGSGKWDYSKLIKLCTELNTANERECHYTMAMLVRAITDHVPPLFDMKNFGEVANQYGARSFKDAMKHLDNGMRKIADSYLHQHIRRQESLPTEQQVNFSPYLDLLLGEIVARGQG
jgi:hypothetical protein